MMDEHLNSLLAMYFPGAKLRQHEKLEGGVSANVTLLDVQLETSAMTRLVLREHGASHCGHPAALEFELLRSLYSLGLAVPEPIAWGNADGADRHPFTLLRYIEGSTDIPASAVEKHIRVMAEQLVAIHGSRTDTLPALPSRSDPRPELLDFLPPEAEWHRLRDHVARMEFSAFSGEPVLLHGDYWPKNLIWQNEKLVGIIDWEDAALGDPLSDVACACLELSYLYGDWGSRVFLDAYRENKQVAPMRFALWQAYVAAAGNRSMGNWGLDPERERSMRQVATASIRNAASALGA
ncbi:aminoglycoside phosphotransferase family protein (plasmid) [Erythrobacteraceae bacterium WH01K]|nr:aminoglycoside phosphotransferase family protein [Erythrobacteraceae bacterium WH01K]